VATKRERIWREFRDIRRTAHAGFTPTADKIAACGFNPREAIDRYYFAEAVGQP